MTSETERECMCKVMDNSKAISMKANIKKINVMVWAPISGIMKLS
jgi:hypothetical protein